MVFDGLEVTGLVEPTGGFSPVLVTVTSAAWKIPNGLDVGAPASRVVTVLGPPMEKTEAALTYHGTSDQVTFHLRGGVIAKITLQYYSD